MTTSNRLGITELAETQNNRSVTINEAIAKLEAGAMFFPAVQVLLNAPPGSPAEGELYVVGTAGSGAWSGHNENVAIYYNAAWLFFTPIEGMFAWDQTSNSLKYYDGADWVSFTFGGGITFASAAEIRTGTEAAKATAPDQIFAAADPVTLTDASTIAVDMATFLNAVVTLGGNRTLGAPSNPKNGQSGCIEIIQDGTGTRTLAYHADWLFAGGTDPVLSTVAGTKDLLFYQVLSTGKTYANLVKAVA